MCVRVVGQGARFLFFELLSLMSLVGFRFDFFLFPLLPLVVNLFKFLLLLLLVLPSSLLESCCSLIRLWLLSSVGVRFNLFPKTV